MRPKTKVVLSIIIVYAIFTLGLVGFETQPLFHGYTDFRVQVGDVWEFVEAGTYATDFDCCGSEGPKYHEAVRAYVTKVDKDCYWFTYRLKYVKDSSMWHCEKSKRLWYYNRKLISTK